MKPISLEQLVSILKGKLPPVFQEFNVQFAYLGGSWARHQNAPWSDIDIFASWQGCESTTPKEFLARWTQLNVEAVAATNFDAIEITFLERVPLHVQFNVISEGILLFEVSEDIRTRFIEHLLQEYPDHMIWFNNFLHQAMGKLLQEGGF